MPDGNSTDLMIQKGDVCSFQDFKDWFNEAPHQRTVAWGKVDFLRERLEQSDQKIKDPIHFLHDLYYDKKLSFRKILEHPVVDGFYSVKGLSNLFTVSFGWEVRTSTDRTPQHAIVANQRVQDGIKDFEFKISELLGGREKTRIFEIEEFRTKKYRIGRALYILKTLGGIDKNMLFILSIEGGLGPRILANALNKQIDEILKKFPMINIQYEDVKLRPQSIERWFAYKENQQSK